MVGRGKRRLSFQTNYRSSDCSFLWFCPPTLNVGNHKFMVFKFAGELNLSLKGSETATNHPHSRSVSGALRDKTRNDWEGD